MDTIILLERLVSIKNNAQERASRESMGDPIRQCEMKAFMLQYGIEQLIMEIQNTMLAEYYSANTALAYKKRVSSQAS